MKMNKRTENKITNIKGGDFIDTYSMPNCGYTVYWYYNPIKFYITIRITS